MVRGEWTQAGPSRETAGSLCGHGKAKGRTWVAWGGLHRRSPRSRRGLASRGLGSGHPGLPGAAAGVEGRGQGRGQSAACSPAPSVEPGSGLS